LAEIGRRLAELFLKPSFDLNQQWESARNVDKASTFLMISRLVLSDEDAVAENVFWDESRC
jgi:hypothetical protein